MSIASLMVHTVTVSRVTRTPDATDGGWTESRADVDVGRKCRVQPLSALEIAKLEALNSRVNCRVYFEGRPDIRFTDRLTFGDDTIEVVAVRDIDRLHRLLTIDGYMQPLADVSLSPSPSASPSPSPSP
ncbi:hypothetical protein LCGC14_1925520 [marine sediment metagenome]|uniref:Uncharacterized protein n=1 Tax=marine sediment metagenome TaxID=412755 RepID=A0A0F9I3A9_9ZZZZ